LEEIQAFRDPNLLTPIIPHDFEKQHPPISAPTKERICDELNSRPNPVFVQDTERVWDRFKDFEALFHNVSLHNIAPYHSPTRKRNLTG
jgi:hypothetical protein